MVVGVGRLGVRTVGNQPGSGGARVVLVVDVAPRRLGRVEAVRVRTPFRKRCKRKCKHKVMSCIVLDGLDPRSASAETIRRTAAKADAIVEVAI